MHTIGEVAKRFDATLRALRFYEDKGLIHPTREGTKRLYSDEDVARIENIVGWVRAGLSIDHVRMALEYYDAGNSVGLQTFIAVSLAQIKQRLNRQLAAIERLQQKEAA